MNIFRIKIISLIVQAIVTFVALDFSFVHIAGPDISPQLFTFCTSLVSGVVGYWFPSPIQQNERA